jgi:hypothetical protein
MIRFSRSTISIGAVSVVVGLVVALGVGAAQGSVLPVAPPHGPPPPPVCEHFVYDGVTQPTVPGCIDLSQGTPMFAPPKGAKLNSVGQWVLNGKVVQGDLMRLPDGRVRMFTPDITEVETGAASPAETAAAAKLGVLPVPGEIDMTPAPLSRFPITPNDNSLGWTKATGP